MLSRTFRSTVGTTLAALALATAAPGCSRAENRDTTKDNPNAASPEPVPFPPNAWGGGPRPDPASVDTTDRSAGVPSDDDNAMGAGVLKAEGDEKATADKSSRGAADKSSPGAGAQKSESPSKRPTADDSSKSSKTTKPGGAKPAGQAERPTDERTPPPPPPAKDRSSSSSSTNGDSTKTPMDPQQPETPRRGGPRQF